MASGENPKKSFGDTKIPLHLIPSGAARQLAWALKFGADKYGAFNWRETQIDAMTYIGAIRRHLDEWAEGCDYAEDSMLHHIAHIMANCAILMDSIQEGCLEDNRAKTKDYR